MITIRSIFLISICTILAGFTSDSSSLSHKGIEFFEGTFGEALLKAKQENKHLFVDVYATWCGPCKQLKRSTFKDEEVGTYFNKNFINISIDGESKEGRIIARQYQVSAYPTLMVLDSDGNVKTKTVGFMKPHILVNFGRRIVP